MYTVNRTQNQNRSELIQKPYMKQIRKVIWEYFNDMGYTISLVKFQVDKETSYQKINRHNTQILLQRDSGWQ